MNREVAATAIARFLRVRLSRQARASRKAVLVEDVMSNSCALVIQAAWRGFAVRRRVGPLPRRRRQSLGATSVFLDETAVLRLQGLCRAFQVRREILRIAALRKRSAYKMRRQSMVPVGYRAASSVVDFKRRSRQLLSQVHNRLATRIQRWWRRIYWEELQAKRHQDRMNRLILLNANAVIIQRWWRDILQGYGLKPGTQHRAADPGLVAENVVRWEEHLSSRQLQHTGLNKVWRSVAPSKYDSKPRKVLPPLRKERTFRPPSKSTYLDRSLPEKVPAGRYASDSVVGRYNKTAEWNQSTRSATPSWYALPKGVIPLVEKPPVRNRRK